MDSVLNFVYEPCAVYFEALFFLEIVLLVLWRGFDYGQCAVRVVVWICLGKLCCKFWGIVSFIDSVLYMLWCGFVYGRCAVVFFFCVVSFMESCLCGKWRVLFMDSVQHVLRCGLFY